MSSFYSYSAQSSEWFSVFILLQGSSSYLTSLEVVAFVRVHGLSCSKASAPYSEHCRSTAHIAGVRFHWSHEESDRCAVSASASGVEPGLYSPRQHEREGARSTRQRWRKYWGNDGRQRIWFSHYSKIKDRFLNQRRWTCKKNMQVLSPTASLVLLFFLFPADLTRKKLNATI